MDYYWYNISSDDHYQYDTLNKIAEEKGDAAHS